MKTLVVTEPTASELLAAALGPGAYQLSAKAKDELVRQLAPPAPSPVTPPPSGDWKAVAAAAAKAAGFDRVILREWDYADPAPTLDTAMLGGLGTNGIMCTRFVPTSASPNVAQLSATQYPGTNMVNTKRLTISATPCDLDPAAPMAGTQSATPKLFYVVGVPPPYPGVAALTPGVPYYINIAERLVTPGNPYGTPTCVPGGEGYPRCELRLQLRKP